MIGKERIAALCVKVLSRAPLVPVVLAPPAAIIMNVAEAGIAHAEEECRIKVETYSPRYPGRSITSLEGNVPCDSRQRISALVPSETGIHDISMNPQESISIPELGMILGFAATIVGVLAIGPQRARDLASRLRR